MASLSSPSLMFTVRRSQPELVPPATPTPHQLIPLSDIDDQEGLRFHISTVLVYRNNKPASMAPGKDPVQVIRKALAQTLVFYYPFAGRLREGPNSKLMVDCNGEGIMFIGADADVTLDHFAGALHPPFPCFQQLLYAEGSQDTVTDTPLLLIQVTRFKCGGFILGMKLNHTMSDGAGLSQFINACAEVARGATKPSIAPVWRRELLLARDPPRVTFNHREYMQFADTEIEEGAMALHDDNMVLRSIFFGPTQIASLRRLVDPQQYCAKFDLITACLWRCRTKALKIGADEDVLMMVAVNARAKFNPPLPVGYYGNAIVYPAAVTTAGKLCGNPFGYAVDLINKVKGVVTEEYVHSVMDLLAVKGCYIPTIVRSFTVSDLRGFDFRQSDFGWGDAVYGGPAEGGLGPFPGVTFLIPYKNAKGEEGFVLPIWLPAEAMNRFTNELDSMFGFISSLL